MCIERKIALGMMLTIMPATLYFIFSSTSKACVVFTASAFLCLLGCMFFFGIPENYVHKDSIKITLNHWPK